MTRSVGHEQPTLQVFETLITLNVVESVKYQFVLSSFISPSFHTIDPILITHLNIKWIFLHLEYAPTPNSLTNLYVLLILLLPCRGDRG